MRLGSEDMKENELRAEGASLGLGNRNLYLTEATQVERNADPLNQ